MGFIYLLRIELYHKPEPKPWVARIVGKSDAYKWEREFVPAQNDWSKAKRMSNGGYRGVVAQFTLREGNVYEISQRTGRGRRRAEERAFFMVQSQQLLPVTEEDGGLWLSTC